MQGKVILLTGAPATGKSTLRTGLAARYTNFYCVDYGQLLLDFKKQRTGASTSYAELRAQSASVISHVDVNELDEALIQKVADVRQRENVVIDSHAVTKEAFGFRVTPFSTEQLGRLRLDAVLVLHLESAQLVERVRSAQDGRREISLEQALQHQLLQQAVAINYSIACRCPTYVVDATGKSQSVVLDEVVAVMRKIGAEFSEKT